MGATIHHQKKLNVQESASGSPFGKILTPIHVIKRWNQQNCPKLSNPQINPKSWASKQNLKRSEKLFYLVKFLSLN